MNRENRRKLEKNKEKKKNHSEMWQIPEDLIKELSEDSWEEKEDELKKKLFEANDLWIEKCKISGFNAEWFKMVFIDKYNELRKSREVDEAIDTVFDMYYQIKNYKMIPFRKKVNPAAFADFERIETGLKLKEVLPTTMEDIIELLQKEHFEIYWKTDSINEIRIFEEKPKRTPDNCSYTIRSSDPGFEKIIEVIKNSCKNHGVKVENGVITIFKM